MAGNLNIDPFKYTAVTAKLRKFFEGKGFVEVHTQNRLSILAACEDPFTIAEFTYNGRNWPLPQTGQMQLEHEILKKLYTEQLSNFEKDPTMAEKVLTNGDMPPEKNLSATKLAAATILASVLMNFDECVMKR